MAADNLPACCPPEVHAAIKANDTRLMRETVYVGEMDDGTERLEIRNCVYCRSSVAVVIGPSRKANKEE